jgi:hypothetical protein
LIRPTVYSSTATSFGSSRLAVLPSLLIMSTPAALAHIGRYSGSWGSNPMRARSSPSRLVSRVVRELSAARSVVLTASGVRPTLRTDASLIMRTRLL